MKKELKQVGVVLLIMIWIGVLGAIALPIEDLTFTQIIICFFVCIVAFPFLSKLSNKHL